MNKKQQTYVLILFIFMLGIIFPSLAEVIILCFLVITILFTLVSTFLVLDDNCDEKIENLIKKIQKRLNNLAGIEVDGEQR